MISWVVVAQVRYDQRPKGSIFVVLSLPAAACPLDRRDDCPKRRRSASAGDSGDLHVDDRVVACLHTQSYRQS